MRNLRECFFRLLQYNHKELFKENMLTSGPGGLQRCGRQKTVLGEDEEEEKEAQEDPDPQKKMFKTVDYIEPWLL